MGLGRVGSMTEIADWIWLVVVVLWLAGRLLPRLFRSQRDRTAAPPQRRQGAETRLSGTESLAGGKPLRPIEPR